MTCIHELAIVFADLWAVDHHRMVEEIYSPDIHMESMCRLDHAPVEDRADLHALEDRLITMIPAHRHELVRVIADGRHACLETTVVSPVTREYAPACVWWWLDDATGHVNQEVGFFDWDRRTNDPARAHGWIPPHERRDISMDDVVDAIESDALAALLAPSSVVSEVGVGPGTLPGQVVVRDHVAAGAVTAALVTGEAGARVWRGTIIVTADESGRLSSVRTYSDGWVGVDRAAVHERIELGSRRQPTAMSSPLLP